ncbi:MAG: O-antigen ligase family protein [Gammaproteobacteria bacterium]
MNPAERHDRLLYILTCGLLGVCFVTGGSSQQSGVGAMIGQLLAIPVLFFALWSAWSGGQLARARWSAVVLAFVILIPVLQLLPVPAWLWNLPPARVSLQHDLAAAGVTGLHYRWSLVPAATERDLLSLLPAVALFVAAIKLRGMTLRHVFNVVIGLALFSLLLGIVQLRAGQSSILNPYPQWVPEMGGVFANPNHQATALAIALVLSVALMIDARRRALRGEGAHALSWIYAGLAVVFVIGIPMAGSRAGPIIAIVPTVVFVMACGTIPFDRLRNHRPAQLFFLLIVAALAVGVYSAMSWMRGDKVDPIRSMLARQTTMIGFTHAPLGAGIGGFVQEYQQGVNASALRDEYINNAHNEYAQLWLEGGVFALFGLLAAFSVFAFNVRRLMKLPARSSSRTMGLAAMAALLVVILHSWVDYPLRTPALLAVFGLLAGVAGTGIERSMADRG